MEFINQPITVVGSHLVYKWIRVYIYIYISTYFWEIDCKFTKLHLQFSLPAEATCNQQWLAGNPPLGSTIFSLKHPFTGGFRCYVCIPGGSNGDLYKVNCKRQGAVRGLNMSSAYWLRGHFFYCLAFQAKHRASLHELSMKTSIDEFPIPSGYD